MKKLFSLLWIGIFMGIIMLPSGCGQKEKAENGDEHGHGEESPSGASFKPGNGVILTPETSEILGLKIVDVTEEVLPQVVELNIQIFNETHRLVDFEMGHTGCEIHGSGFLPPEEAALVKPKQPVKLFSDDEAFDGFVVSVKKPFAGGEIEIIIGVTTADTKLEGGDFVRATITMSRDKPVAIIPSSALLRTVGGTFVYALNGNAYYRTAVKVGRTADDKIEVIDGLYPGDQVVTKPVETLWLIELRATKGGGHSH